MLRGESSSLRFKEESLAQPLHELRPLLLGQVRDWSVRKGKDVLCSQRDSWIKILVSTGLMNPNYCFASSYFSASTTVQNLHDLLDELL